MVEEDPAARQQVPDTTRLAPATVVRPNRSASRPAAMHPIAPAAMTETKRCAGTRSARFVIALASAPITKPSWTLAVSQAHSGVWSSQVAVSSSATADAENHGAIANSSTTTKRREVGAGR